MPRTKTNNRIYHQLMSLCKSKGGRLDMTDTDMLTLIGGAHRAATQFSSIRRFEKMTVDVVREGRKVVTYVMPAYQILADAPTPETTEIMDPVAPDVVQSDVVETVHTSEEPVAV